MKTLACTTLAAVIIATGAVADEVAVTVYNRNLAVVRETRTLEFTRGINRMNLTDVAASIDPTSVHFKLRDGKGVQLLEQNFQYDLVSPDKVLQKYIGSQIDVVMKNGELYSGKFLSAAGGTLMLQLPDGSVRMINAAERLSVSAPRLPEGLVLVPTLEWLISSEISGKRAAEVSYLTSNIGWHAEYIAALDEKEQNLRLSGWVSLDNRSGKTYRDAKLKLVAGDISRVTPPPIAKGVYDERMATMAAPGFEEKAFFEYHLYTLSRPTTIGDNETKQVSLFEPASTPVKKIYRYNAFEGNKDVNVVVSFVNSEQNNLGMPLPAGKIRITKADTDGSEELIGEDAINHTPRNEEVELKVGNAFDIVAETVTMDTKRISDRVREFTIEVKVRNRKTENVTVYVRYNLYGDWQILESSHEYKKKSARLVEFAVPATADQETTLRFRTRVN